MTPDELAAACEIVQILEDGTAEFKALPAPTFETAMDYGLDAEALLVRTQEKLDAVEAELQTPLSPEMMDVVARNREDLDRLKAEPRAAVREARRGQMLVKRLEARAARLAASPKGRKRR